MIMARAARLFGVFCLLFLLHPCEAWSAVTEDSTTAGRRCFDTVTEWSEAQLRALSSLPVESAEERMNIHELLFFLHIPRTGGRSLHMCFLKHLFESEDRCPRSYDKLRLQPGCRLISTHDDYSLLDKVPQGITTSVMTNFREPTDRVLSAYEFSIEVAARSLARKRTGPPRAANISTGSTTRVVRSLNTLDIWPWKHLVPMMMQDLFNRRDARLAPGSAVEQNVSMISVNDSYDASALAMPLHEFIYHPVARDIVHNGATFQVAGLTNTSYSKAAGPIRSCVVRYPRLGKHVVQVAKKRLDRMLFIGLTDRLNDSAFFIAKALGGQFSKEVLMREVLKRRQSTARRKDGLNPPKLPPKSLDEYSDEDVIVAMLDGYNKCVSTLRKSQEDRRTMSLLKIAPVQFGREMRKFIPNSVVEEIHSLNSLDEELYAHAQMLFEQQQELLQKKYLHPMDDELGQFTEADLFAEHLNDTSDFFVIREFSEASKYFPVLWMVITFFTVLVAVLYIVTKRRGARGLKET